ncbi:MAG TPA: LysR substrate-binding domain-containing protein [Hyphomicrobiaceae bacterium]|jgi:DNA-binding transcriptional LysR family regulator|nr:LysR substrate-binding domain-containing protein [Hyphomicrobiaceae bacterium]
MTLEQLRIFVAVAEHEHVTQAARVLNLTQSATSAAIAALEGRYETKLFHRVGRRIELTGAGRMFLAEAKAVLQRAGAAETLLSDIAGLKRGTLSVAASQTVGNYWLPRLIQQYRSRYPGIALSLSLGNTESVAGMVHDGAADLGFIEGDIDDPVLVVRSVAEDRLVLVVAAGHAWARRPPRSPEEFCAASWVCRERGSGTRSILEAALPALGIARENLRIAVELPSNEAVCTAVEAGAGATIISRLVVERALAAGLLVAVPASLPTRNFSILRHKERYVTVASSAFAELATERAGATLEAVNGAAASPQ